ncbi:hypothetical protein BLJAPNOD_06324 [Ensifer sp. M14]|uniref:Uncharacterized protein n=1 Tax=Sinorhizobium sp. M14 TaxID=430451 RepID=A0A142BPG4_9HYPH|nr:MULTISPECIES: hypothetical protein [Sinorhizobium/Ensifer group]AMP34972.1 hypothetical protein pSinB_107 [Sinorhizobium sp. M14]RDL47484.1 hypothetical protein BLJAPNOD_06324 [Ensifer sp. M14]
MISNYVLSFASACSFCVLLVSYAPAAAGNASEADLSSDRRLATELATCSGGLSATTQYDGYVEGLRESRMAAADALAFVLESAALPGAEYEAIARKQAVTLEAELLASPMQGRALAISTKEKCAGPIARAQTLYDTQQKAADAPRTDAAEGARQQTLHIEEEVSRVRAQADARVRAAEQAKQGAEGQAARQVKDAAEDEATALNLKEPARDDPMLTSGDQRSATAQSKPESVEAPDNLKLNPITCSSFYGLTKGFAPASKRSEMEHSAEALFSESGGTADQLVETTVKIARLFKMTEKHGEQATRHLMEFFVEGCNVVVVETNAAYSEELALDGSDPVHGSACYTWANVARTWWQQNAERSLMKAQAEAAMANPGLYRILATTIDGIANRDPLTGKAVQSNRWNRSCVATLTGRRS